MLLQWLIVSNTWALSFGYLASFLLLYFVVILKMKNGHIIARNFFIAYSFVIIAIFITILRRYALFDITWNSVLWVYIMNIACFIEILLLSFAQTEKFRLKQIEKSKQLRESEQKYRISAQKLQQKNVELQHYIASNTELQSFSYAVSHDLKQPLRTISSFATLLERRLQKNNIEDSQIADYLTFIKEGGKNMNSLITDLLEYSKAGNLTNENFVENDFNEIIQRVENNLKNQIEESEAKIIYHNLPTNLRAVNVKMIQLFQNLISNAIKFRDENRALKIEIAVAEKENLYQFEIKDNGMGIEEAHISKIFQVFFKNHENSKTEGSGIGLSLCQKIVVAHGGNIWLTSEKGVGTSFMFTIPKK
jgi:signal transduction histidine kinase